MKVKNVVFEDFVNYKEAALFIIMPNCSFKCDKENGTQICQNWSLRKEPDIEISNEELIKRFDENPITKAIIFGGLEPFDSEEDLQNFLKTFRKAHNEVVVIYTGYTEEEVKEKFGWIFQYKNLVIKFGRFRPNEENHYDEVLGVNLASHNQYGRFYE